ncbi:MAG TPA: MauE/DoxX family redox-associated membrane protein [Ktedonobacteraceae bacterium]|nr:MauE/DoxX family redox-associated membrane protein [Ktedonobacteraceae bacterium]
MDSPFLELVGLSARSFLAIVLIVAGAAKLADKANFSATLARLGVSSHQETRSILALLLPISELALGLFVASGLWSGLANVAVLLVMLGFDGVTLYAIRRAPDTTCRCFGALSDTPFNQKTLLRNAVLTALAVIALVSSEFPVVSSGASPWLVAVVLAGYLVVALAAVHAARVVQSMRERMSA